MTTIERKARTEARRRYQDQNRLNVGTLQCEFAYSPTTGAVGMRWQDSQYFAWSASQSFSVFNIYYPMYGRSEHVTDWVSVGVTLPRTTRR